VALQPSASYGLLWLCSPARAMASCGSAAQHGLWPSIALQPSASYGLLWLCSPARAMASCGSAAQRELWPPHITRFLDHTQLRATVGRTPLERVISPSQRSQPENTQHTQQTNIHATGGIRTHDRRRRAAVDLRLRSRGRWDRERLGVMKVKTYDYVILKVILLVYITRSSGTFEVNLGVV
jgi:hypothetical protein